DAHGEAGQIVLARGVEVGELGRLAADQRAAGPLAALDDAGHDRLHPRGVEPRDPDVVEEVEGGGAVDQEIVHAHGHEVDPDRVVPVGEEGDLQLAADAVGGGDEHRLR